MRNSLVPSVYISFSFSSNSVSSSCSFCHYSIQNSAIPQIHYRIFHYFYIKVCSRSLCTLKIAITSKLLAECSGSTTILLLSSFTHPKQKSAKNLRKVSCTAIRLVDSCRNFGNLQAQCIPHATAMEFGRYFYQYSAVKTPPSTSRCKMKVNRLS